MFIIRYTLNVFKRIFRKTLTLGLAVLVCLYLLSGCKAPSDVQSGETSSKTNPNTDETATVELNTVVQGEGFNAIEFEWNNIPGITPQTMEGKTGYKQREDARQYSLDWKESLDLQPTESVYEPTGHKIYEGSDGGKYILSDDVPVWIRTDRKLDLNQQNGFLREERTGKLIRTFITQTEIDMFNKGYEDGQAILTGKKEAIPQSIIFDGVLTPFTFEGQAGKDALINVADISLWTAPDYFVYQSDDPVVTVSANENYSVQFRTMLLRRDSYEKLDVNVVNNSYRFRSDGVEFRISLLNPDDPTLPVEQLARVLGWTVYTDGNCLSICSDTSNLTDKAILYNPNEILLERVVERNDENILVSRVYDRFHNIVEESPYEGADNEYIQSIVPKNE